MDTTTTPDQTVEDLTDSVYAALQDAQEAVERLTASISALREHPEDPDGTYWAQEAAAEAGKALEKAWIELPADGFHKKSSDQ